MHIGFSGGLSKEESTWKPKRRWEYDIKMTLLEREWNNVDLINMAQCRTRCGPVCATNDTSTAINYR